MHELVKKYLDEGKAKEQELLDEEALKKKEQRDRYLIRLGLISGTERRYNKKYGDPYYTWDKKEKMYYYDAPIPVEVTDEELEEIQKYEKFQGESPSLPVEEKPTIKNGAEETLSAINSIFYVLAWIAAFIMFVLGMSKGFYGLVWNAVQLVIYSTIAWAVVKVYVNISNNLHELNAKSK